MDDQTANVAEPPSTLVEVWRTAATDLDIEVLAPYETGDGRQYAALVRGFGGVAGTLVDWIGSGHCPTGGDDGFYVSILNPDAYDSYDRERLQETLNDWAWKLDPAPAPSWYTGAAWT